MVRRSSRLHRKHNPLNQLQKHQCSCRLLHQKRNPLNPLNPLNPIEPVAKAAQPAQDAEAEKQEANRALMAATRDGDIEAIKQQLAAGADVNAIDDEGLTALDRFGDEETAALLYKHGAKRARDLKAEGK